MSIVIVYTSFAIYMIGFYYPTRYGWSTHYIVGIIVLILCTIIELLSKFFDILLNNRTVIMVKDITVYSTALCNNATGDSTICIYSHSVCL